VRLGDVVSGHVAQDGPFLSCCSLGDATLLVVRSAFCVLATETSSHLQAMDKRIPAHDADPGTMLHNGQLIHFTTGHPGQYIAQGLLRDRDVLSELIHLCAICAYLQSA